MLETEKILPKALKVLERPVCDHCLGRQFAQLLSGYTNAERGAVLRTLAAMSIDNEKLDNDIKIDLSNFSGYKFHNLEAEKVREQKCSVCDDLFRNMEKIAERVISKVKKYQFRTFLMGTKLSSELTEKEESLWERAGIDYCEPIKAEINRELGKKIEKKAKMKFDLKRPDANLIVKMPSGAVDIQVNPLFIYGEYQKLVRGIPQTKWPSGKYKISVEQIIAKPFMSATRGKAHKLHGAGREDIDARCLGWRPFVLEIVNPVKREINLKALAKKINMRVRVRNIRFSGINEVRSIKESRHDKSYRAIVVCEKPITRNDLKKLDSLVEVIRQKTPTRVLHRRADRFRKRRLISIRAKIINKKTFEIVVRCEAGMYVKELINGDSGRTQPSISQILGMACSCKELDVVDIHTN